MSLNSLRLPRRLSRSTYELYGSRGISTTYWRQHHISVNLVRVSFSITMIIRYSNVSSQFLFTGGERDDLSTKQASRFGAGSVSLAPTYYDTRGRFRYKYKMSVELDFGTLE